MKFYRFIFSLIFLITLTGCLESSREAPSSLAKKYGDNVVLYATHWCGYCQKKRDFLSQHNIKYTEYDIEASQDGLQEFEALGGKGIPLVLVKGRVVEGYAPNAILKVLNGT